MVKTFQLGLLMFAFAWTPAMAEPHGPRADRIVVPTADLDLGSKSGQRRLDRRLSKAVTEACGTASHVDLAGGNKVRRCLEVVGKLVATARNQRVARASARPNLFAGR